MSVLPLSSDRRQSYSSASNCQAMTIDGSLLRQATASRRPQTVLLFGKQLPGDDRRQFSSSASNCQATTDDSSPLRQATARRRRRQVSSSASNCQTTTEDSSLPRRVSTTASLTTDDDSFD